jgi:hypothetical protein
LLSILGCATAAVVGDHRTPVVIWCFQNTHVKMFGMIVFARLAIRSAAC